MNTILRDREVRAEHRDQWISDYGLPIIVMRVNMPGMDKQHVLTTFIYDVIKVQLQLSFEQHLHHTEDFANADGMAFFAAVKDLSSEAIKTRCLEIEEKHPLGRLVDIDVTDVQGSTLSRVDFGYSPRKCYLCEETAHGCARSQKHSLKELHTYMETSIQAYQERVRDIARHIGSTATRAMLYEVSATPKPGLVDRDNSGAHTDMDFYTFLDSSSVLSHYFTDCAKAVVGSPLNELLAHLRPLGIEAERQMFEATLGVNTQKGMIFSLGILSAACAVVALNPFIETDEKAYLQTVSKVAARIAGKTIADELSQIEQPMSYGEKQFAAHGLLGARGEAVSGYKTVLDIGVPTLEEALYTYRFSMNDAMILTLMKLSSVVMDSNVIGRRGLELLSESQGKANAISALAYDDPASFITAVKGYDAWCTENRISHGGASDLLAVTVFLTFMKQSAEKRRF